MILAVVCWRMPGRDTTVLCLPMGRLGVESPTLWLAMELTKVQLCSACVKCITSMIIIANRGVIHKARLEVRRPEDIAHLSVLA